MSEPFRILTVCIGNVCRSPLAERLLRDRLAGAFEVASAGVRGLEGTGMEEHAAAELVRLGGSPEGFVARRFAPELVTGVDLVLAATTSIRDRVIQQAPQAMRRTFTILELADLAGRAPAEIATPKEVVAWCASNRSLVAGGNLDIDDPMGKSAEVHRTVADELDRATRVIADRLNATVVG